MQSPSPASLEREFTLQAEPQFRHDLLRIVALLLRESRLIIILTLVAAVVSAICSFVFLPNWYASSVNAVPPRRASSGLESLTGGLSSALKDIGIAKVSGKSASEGYSLTVIFNSRRMKDTIIQLYRLHELYRLDSTEMTNLRKEYDNYIFVTPEAEGNYMITALHTDRNKAAEIANKIYELGNTFADEVFQAESRLGLGLLEKRFKQAEDSQLSARDTLVRFSRRYKLFSPIEQAKAAAGALADIRVQQYRQELNVDLSSALYGEADPTTQLQRGVLRKVQQQASKAENQPGLAGDFALSSVGADVALEYMRLYADLEVYTKVKALLIPVIEQNRQDLSRRQPTLIMLDQAVPADTKDRPKRSLIIGGVTLAAFVFAVLFVILRDRYYAVRVLYKAMLSEAARDVSTP
jgi:tyrosine-protein kinase Etk/Wzc